MSIRSGLTIIGTAVGYYFGGPAGASFGALIGGTVGGIVDPVKIDGPRLKDLKVTSSAYGAPIPWIFGADNRIAGNVIWSSGLKERKKTSGGKGGGTETTEYSYSTDVAVALGAGPCLGLRRIWANGKLLWDVSDQASTPAMIAYDGLPWVATRGAGLPKIALDSLAFYPGNETQTADPTIEAAVGAGLAPAYRGTCYVVLKKLQLADYGNSLPNLEFEIDGRAPRTVAAIARDIFDNAGLSSIEHDEHPKLSEQAVAGYIISNTSQALSAIFPLAETHFFDITEAAGVVLLVPRDRGPIATIDIGDVGARSRSDEGSDGPESVSINRAGSNSLPRSATLTYRSKSRDYQEQSQTAVRAIGDSENKIESAVAITLSDDRARQIADTMLFEPWVARQSLEIAVSAAFGFLKPGDTVSFPVAGIYTPFRVLKCPRGDDGRLNLSLVSADPTVYESAAPAEVGAIPPNVPVVVLDSIPYPFNSPILYAGEADTAFSYAVGYPDPSFRSALFLRSVDGGANYSQVGDPIRVPNITGTVAAALPSGPTDVFDYGNTITVTLHSVGDVLESRTEADILNGFNGCWLGAADGSHGEALQFATATLVTASPRVYTLSGLLRGRRATEHEVGLHAASDIFVLLESEFFHTADYSLSDLDRSRLYKAVTALQDEIEATAVTFTNTGERAKCRSPVLAAGARDGSNNLTITWVRRVRGFAPGLGYGFVPLDEPVEAYEVDIYSGAAVVRTIAASMTTAIYTAAQQTADGLTPGAAVSVKIYQLSATRGRGHPGIFSV